MWLPRVNIPHLRTLATNPTLKSCDFSPECSRGQQGSFKRLEFLPSPGFGEDDAETACSCSLLLPPGPSPTIYQPAYFSSLLTGLPASARQCSDRRASTTYVGSCHSSAQKPSVAPHPSPSKSQVLTRVYGPQHQLGPSSFLLQLCLLLCPAVPSF